VGTRRGRRGAFVAFGAAAFGVVAVGVIAIEVAAMTAVWVAGGRVGIAVAIGAAAASRSRSPGATSLSAWPSGGQPSTRLSRSC